MMECRILCLFKLGIAITIEVLGWTKNNMLINNRTEIIESLTNLSNAKYRISTDHVVSSSSDIPGSNCIFLIGAENCHQYVYCYNVAYDLSNTNITNALYLNDTVSSRYSGSTNDGERSLAINITIYYTTTSTIEKYSREELSYC